MKYRANRGVKRKIQNVDFDILKLNEKNKYKIYCKTKMEQKMKLKDFILKNLQNKAQL